MKTLLLLGLLLCGVAMLTHAATDKVVCYYGSWGTYHQSHGKFDIEDINPNLCTHVIYAFVGLDPTSNMVKLLDPATDASRLEFQRFVGLKTKNPSLKVMAAVGGWNEGSTSYSAMASLAVSRKAFIDSVVTFLHTYGFDGLDIDWEYPTQRGGSSADRVNFITLLSELRQRFNTERLLLSIAVGASKGLHQSAYNVPEINKYVDFVNLMAYDIHSQWDGRTGHNAPLFAAQWETDSSTSLLNVDACVRGWLDDGLDASKLVMGVPAYGQTFTLASTANTGVGVQTTGGGTAGAYTGVAGSLSYLEICERMKTGYTKMWDDVQKVPYAFMGNQWISYDDVTSLTQKIKYAKSENLGGVMIWSLDSDDARNYCGQGAYPIGTVVYNAVFGSTGPVTTTTTAATTTTTKASTTPVPVTTTTTAATTTTTKAATTSTTPVPVTTTTTAATTTTTKAATTPVPVTTTTTAATTTTTTAATTTTTTKVATTTTTTVPVTTTTTTTTTPKPVTTTTTTVATTTTPKPATTTSTTTIKPTTTSPSSALICINGLARDPTDCQYFYQCDGTSFWRFKCQDGLYFDATGGFCNWANLVVCNIH